MELSAAESAAFDNIANNFCKNYIPLSPSAVVMTEMMTNPTVPEVDVPGVLAEMGSLPACAPFEVAKASEVSEPVLPNAGTRFSLIANHVGSVIAVGAWAMVLALGVYGALKR